MIGGSPTGTFGTSQRTGAGQTIAILDTGVMKTHTFLAHKVVSEACYSSTDTSYGSLAVCEFNSTAPGSGVNCTISTTGCDHGTHVAGVAAGNGAAFNGVAKDATIIAIQVFSEFSEDYCGIGKCVLSYTSDQMKGLERVYSLRSRFAIASITMSLGGGAYSSYCDDDARKSIIDQLASVGIATAIAAGNDGSSNSVSAPGCISTAITVGSTTKSDTVSSFSNTSQIVDLLAPGSSIYSSTSKSTTAFEYQSGTSMATPHIAGAWAVIKQQKTNATVVQVQSALQSTGLLITDSKSTSVTKPRIRLSEAVNRFNTTTIPSNCDGQDGVYVYENTDFASGRCTRYTNDDSHFGNDNIQHDTASSIRLVGQWEVTLYESPDYQGSASTFLADDRNLSDNTIGDNRASSIHVRRLYPRITSLSPGSAATGGPGFNLVVDGKNFAPTSIVRWNNSPRASRFISASQLVASIPAIDIAASGSANVTVYTPTTPGGDVSNALVFTTSSACDNFEPNNTPDKAPVFVPGNTETHAFCTGDDVDWVKFTARAGTTYRIETMRLAPGVDTVLSLYQPDGVTLLAESNDSGGSAASLIGMTFTTSGTYYLKVRQRDGRGGPGYVYNLRIASKVACNSYEANNTFEQARVFSIGSTEIHTFCSANDEDWVKFSAVPGTTFRLETLGLMANTDTVLTLYKLDGNTLSLITEDNNSGGMRASLIRYTPTSSGMYYLRARQFGSGSGTNYTYNLRITGASVCNNFEPNNNVYQAQPFMLGSTDTHAFCVAGDDDWVKFSAVAGMTYRIETLRLATNTNTTLALFESNGTTLLAINDDSGGTYASLLSFTPSKSGEYYVRLRQTGNRGGPGYTYNLRITGTSVCNNYESNNGPGQSRMFTLETIEIHAFCVSGDTDWVKFKATAGAAYRIETSALSSSTDTVVTLFQPDGTSIIATDDDSGDGYGSLLKFAPTTTGIYYVQASQYDSKGGPAYTYNLSISVDNAVGANDTKLAPTNDSIAK